MAMGRETTGITGGFPVFFASFTCRARGWKQMTVQERGMMMRFREMAAEMSGLEIRRLLEMVCPYGKLKRYERRKGFIIVYYSLPADAEGVERRMDFLPDNIYVVGDGEQLDGEPVKNGDILHRYMQYMIAKGYSEYWLDNPYTDR